MEYAHYFHMISTKKSKKKKVKGMGTMAMQQFTVQTEVLLNMRGAEHLNMQV